MKQIKITRWGSIEPVSRENWKDLISALAMVGYEIYADEDNIVFTLGYEDEVKEIEEK